MTPFDRPGRPQGDPPKAAADPIASFVATARSARMVEHQIAFLLAVAARLPVVFAAARDRLDATLFEPAETRFVLFWRGAVAATDNGNRALPADPDVAREVVAMKCAAEVANDPAMAYYTPSVQRAVMAEGGLLDELFALKVTPDLEAEGFDLLARFLTERKACDPLRRAFAGLTAADTLTDPEGLVRLIEDHVRDVSGFAVDPGSAAVVDADDFLPPGPRIVPTKLPWLDDLMAGGQAPKEVYTLLAISGGGKSACGVQIAVEGAELQNSLAADLGPDEAGFWYYFTWELTEPELRERVYIYGARVSFSTFTTRDPVTRKVCFSTAADPATLKPYEFDPYVNSPGNPVAGELERMRALRRRLSGPNDRLRIVDYSGDKVGKGLGGIEEAAAYLHAERARGRRVAGVVIDYAGLVVNAVIGRRRLRPDAEFSLLAGFVDDVRKRVAIPYECPAWVLHQFHGDVAKRRAGAAMHHSEARGCRNFADNATFAVNLSPYNKTTGLLAANVTKHRRAPGREDDVIVRFDSALGAFRSPDRDYVYDSYTKSIVPRDFLDAMPGAHQPAYQPPPAGRGRPPVDPAAGV